MAKPVVRCEGGSISPTKALKGSMLMLIEASIIQSVPTAIHKIYALGIKHNPMEASMAPSAK